MSAICDNPGSISKIVMQSQSGKLTVFETVVEIEMIRVSPISLKKKKFMV